MIGVVRRLAVVLTTGLLVATAAPAAATPGPPDAPEYWFDAWKVEQLWQSGVRGQGVTIAEVDTGVNAQLPELAANVLPGKDFGRTGDGRIDRELNEFGHGTAMASIMVGRQGLLGIAGLAPSAKLLPIAVPLTGTTDATANDHLAEAIRWAVDHGGKVVSMSLGAPQSPADVTVPCPAAEQAAVYYALSKGAVLLAAAGNHGEGGNPVEEPGVCLGVVSVGASDQAGAPAAFSSRHRYLTLAAPGVAIASLSRVSGSAYSGDGTSQATAIASSVVALVWSKYPKLTGEQVITRVLATLDRRRTRHDTGIGFGVINAYRAVTSPVPAGAANPVYAAAAPFLARQHAFAKADSAVTPPRAADTRAPTGRFSIGQSPRLLVPRVLGGVAVALTGLLALITLTVAAGIRRRRRHPVPEVSMIEHVATGEAMPARPDASMAWHDISTPPEPTPDRTGASGGGSAALRDDG
ncbi:MAG: S8 family serine peptidase [Actinomycetota bacterium]|nr:S8 family serine peptidase [Actinomycetota bacterium]